MEDSTGTYLYTPGTVDEPILWTRMETGGPEGPTGNHIAVASSAHMASHKRQLHERRHSQRSRCEFQLSRSSYRRESCRRQAV